METRKPVGRFPRNVPIQDDEGNIGQKWGLWLETVRENLYDIRLFDIDIDPPSLTTQESTEVDVTAPEVEADDVVLAASKPSIDAGYIIGGTRATEGKIHISFSNVSTETVDPSTETFTFVIIKG